jgi:glucose dehydrogenase
MDTEAMRIGVFALFGALLPLWAAAQQSASPGGQWLSYNNGLHGQRYSPLKQINTGNAARLGTVCRVQIDGPGSFHAGLIVEGSTIFTATPRETVALDATTCAPRWRYTYRAEEGSCGGSSRGVALLDGRIFRGTCDGRLIALDAATG